MVNGEIPVLMPKMSMTMAEGTLLVWHKSPGDSVRSGEPVCDVATDKVDMEVEAPATGTLSRILADPDDVVPVGQPIAYIAGVDDDLLGGLLDDPATDAPAEPQPEPSTEPTTEPSTEPTTEPTTGPPTRAFRPPVVPLARAQAAALRIDLDTVTGSGPGGFVRVVDVELAGSARRGAARNATARRMRAGAAVPQLTLYADLDLDALAGDRRGHSWTAFFVRAFAVAVRDNRDLNASLVDGQLKLNDHVGVAVAIDTPRGLLAPVLHDPDRLTMPELSRSIRDLAAQARRGRVPLANLSGATATLLNLGRSGVAAGQIPLTPPQASALVVGAVDRQPVATESGITVCTRCRIGLTVNHQVADASQAARLLRSLGAVLADPDLAHGRR